MTVKEALDIVLHTECLGDYVYQVRDQARESEDGFEGNSWDHPRVIAFNEAVDVLENYYKTLDN